MSTRSNILVRIKTDDKSTTKKFNPSLVDSIFTNVDGGMDNDTCRAKAEKNCKEVELNGDIIQIYHHWDGYPEGVGETLMGEYNTYEKALNLCLGGDISSCVDNNYTSYAVRGEDWKTIKPRMIDTDKPEEIFDGIWIEYLYLFDGDKWLFAEMGENEWKDLKEYLAEKKD